MRWYFFKMNCWRISLLKIIFRRSSFNLHAWYNLASWVPWHGEWDPCRENEPQVWQFFWAIVQVCMEKITYCHLIRRLQVAFTFFMSCEKRAPKHGYYGSCWQNTTQMWDSSSLYIWDVDRHDLLSLTSTKWKSWALRYNLSQFSSISTVNPHSDNAPHWARQLKYTSEKWLII